MSEHLLPFCYVSITQSAILLASIRTSRFLGTVKVQEEHLLQAVLTSALAIPFTWPHGFNIGTLRAGLCIACSIHVTVSDSNLLFPFLVHYLFGFASNLGSSLFLLGLVQSCPESFTLGEAAIFAQSFSLCLAHMAGQLLTRVSNAMRLLQVLCKNF
jgi:hypothetical protein